MGLFASRQNATVEETDVSLNHLYKYPPRTGNYFGTHFIMGGERFDTPQPEAYLFGENADLNFLGSKPTPFPYPPPQATEPTKTLKSLVNIRKESVRFVKVSEGGGANGNKPVNTAITIANGDPTGKGLPATAVTNTNGGISNGYNIEFVFDADHACLITIYYFCIEDIGAGGLNYISRDSSMTSETFHFQRGVNQVFSAPHHIIYPALYADDDLSYNPERDTFPVVIHCVIGEGGTTTGTTTMTNVGADAQGEVSVSRQSHATICVIDHHSDGTYALRALKQKIFVDGLYYLLQEIYGIENKLTSKSITDEETEDNGSECVICMCDTRDTLILPCRHLCLCNSCADSLRYQANNCPICRAPFRALLQIRAVQKDNGSGLPCGGTPAGQNSSDSADNIPAGYKTISLIEALNGPTVTSKATTNGGNDTTAVTDNGSENNRGTENGYGFRSKMTKSSTDHSSNGELANGSIVSEKSPSDIRAHLLSTADGEGVPPGDGTEAGSGGAGGGGGGGGGITNPTTTVCTKKELLSKHSPLLQRAPQSKDKNPREKGSLHRIGANHNAAAAAAAGGAGSTGPGKSKSVPSAEKTTAFHLVHEKPVLAVGGGVGGGSLHLNAVGGSTKTKPIESKLTTDSTENDDDSDGEKLSPLLRKSPPDGSSNAKGAMKKLLVGGGAASVAGNEMRNEMKTSPSTVITELLKGAIIGNDDIGGGTGGVGGGPGGRGGGVGGGGSIITIVADDSEDYYTPEDPPATSPLKSIDDDDEEEVLPKLAGEPDVDRKLLSGAVGVPIPLLGPCSPPSLAPPPPPPAPPSALSMLKEEFSAQGSLPDSPISGNSQTSTRSSSDSYSSSSSTRQLLSAGAVANDTPTHVLSSGDSTTNGHSGASKSNECSIESD